MALSKRKGKDGENEVARILRSLLGRHCRRGQQYNGADGSADVVGIPGLHIEVKRREKLNLGDAMQQSRQEALAGEVPVVVHRRNRQPWRLTCDLEDLPKLIEALSDAKRS